MIKFGPAGLGPVKTSESVLKEYSKLGIRACEIAFTYGIYINKEEAKEIKKYAEKYGIELSIHAPYWINLNSEEKSKIEKSKQRILNCCEIGEILGATKVVFHPGFYSKFSKEESYQRIKNQIIEMQDFIKRRNYKIKLAPETTGKLNVFGSIEEINSLVNETNCSFCVDFAHILARYKDYNFDLILKYFEKYKSWHLHFSGIEYGQKGEKKHLVTKKEDLKKVLMNLPKNKDITFINESPTPVEDSILGIKIYESLVN